MADQLLVVDDNEANRDLLSRRLVRAGYEVRLAEDGQQAIDMVAAHRFDLVLLDVMMPGIDGLTVLRLTRATYSMAELPIIMVTARTDSIDVVDALEKGANDYVVKPINFPVVLARVKTQLSIKHANDKIRTLAAELEKRNDFIRKTFGRYVSDQVVQTVLDEPQGLSFDGVHREVSILITDIRGFTLLADSLPAEEIVRLLNNYLEQMIEITESFGGTVAEIVGDGVLAFFGAPVADEAHATHAVACAVQMQIAMNAVNLTGRRLGLPEIQVGIGIHSGEGAVGNIGSQKRSKYAVVGSVVNLASRIEGATAGRQIMISEATRASVGDILSIVGQRTIQPKGARAHIDIFEVSGIAGDYNLHLDQFESELLDLSGAVVVNCTLVAGKSVSEVSFTGTLLKLSLYRAELRTDIAIDVDSELRLRLPGSDGHLYGRVMHKADDVFGVLFSSLSPDARDMIDDLMKSG